MVDVAFGCVICFLIGLVAGAFFLYGFAHRVVEQAVDEYRKAEGFVSGEVKKVESVAAGIKREL